MEMEFRYFKILLLVFKHILYSDFYLQQMQVIMKWSCIKWKYDGTRN